MFLHIPRLPEAPQNTLRRCSVPTQLLKGEHKYWTWMATLNTAVMEVLPITDKQYACSRWNTFLLSVGKSKWMQCFLQIPIYTFHKTLIPCSPVHESTPNSFLLVSQLAVIDGRLQPLQNWEYCRAFLLQTKEISSIKISWMAIPIVTQKQLIHGKEKKKKKVQQNSRKCVKQRQEITISHLSER